MNVPSLPCQAPAHSHPLCTDCRDLVTDLRAAGHEVNAVEVRDRPDLARKYGVAVVPMAFTVDRTGTVLARIAG